MADDPRSGRRAYATALLLLAAGGLVLLVSFGQPWGTVQVALAVGVDGAVRLAESTGGDLFPAAAVSGWISLAGVAGVVATRSWGRTAIAAFLLAAGLAGAAAGVVFAADPARFLPEGSATQTTLWWLGAVLGGVLVSWSAGWTAYRGRTWPAMGVRYERTRATDRTLTAWEAQDIGQDPTDDLVE